MAETVVQKAAPHAWYLSHDFSGEGKVLFCPAACPGPKPEPNLTYEERHPDAQEAARSQG